VLELELVVLGTTPVGAETAVADPALFVAVTMARSVWPAFPEVTAYVDDVAPDRVVQLPPAESHCCQLYAYAIGVAPDQVPVETVSVEPTEALPLIAGTAVTLGTVVLPPDETAGVCADWADADPAALDAVTRTRTVLPARVEVRARDEAVAPEIEAQEAPVESHDSHW
jgi:hypothetical protein